MTRPRQLLQRLFQTAWQSASPEHCLSEHLQRIDHSSIILLALGKSATQMTAVATKQFGDRIRTGLAVTAYKHSVNTGRIETIESAHPVPDDNSLQAATRLLQMAEQAQADDLLLMLLSGGGSSLAAAPIDMLTLQQKQHINSQLLKSGANINQINNLRKHLSGIKGGRLALAAQPAQVRTLAISDVPENSPQSIASGPTLADDSSCADCLRMIDDYQLDIPQQIIELLANNSIETPNADNPAFANNHFDIIASPRQALDATMQFANRLNLHLVNLGAEYYEDAADIAASHCQQISKSNSGTLILSGGEASVRVTGTGQGGRNGQFLLSLACQLEQMAMSNKKIWVIACDSDGIDGKGDNAGCILTPDSMVRAREAGLDPQAMLSANNSYPFFAKLNDLVITGPTGTNVNDFRAILVL